jgi:peptidoglycan L-alanyl-D-glutamate endopeptidase CwlK
MTNRKHPHPQSSPQTQTEYRWTPEREQQAADVLRERARVEELHRGLLQVPRLENVHPRLLELSNQLTAAMGVAGFPMMVTDGLRTLEEQQKLYAQGRTVPGQIVTNADGVHNRSNHQPHDDGLGHALDLTFINPANSRPFWPTDATWMKRWRAYGKLAVAMGLEWGGDWTRPDLPHIQLP